MSDINGFNAAYKILQANAEKLRRQDDLDIDSLVPIVEESAKAYQVCKERIAAVRAALQEHLKEENPDAPQK
ncbi:MULTISPECIES: exodeoxyribonuclease VII small subunit [Noviherbaspirillum]|jgi:exodeoxyribonuclease VII small subunit|uniref:Exodeoxyribonuclease VII small subunit n=1 Tax=Noviherbaspirillum album TaxID=3080276 RepID=A0ABU6JIQ5_9BURK|nr:MULTISPECIES: exodeoxyribonuclease VII small subunit [Noviherbaspirillum]MEC4723564.1 exodeoxyribonuclease VII small subunit [Noviherbaspirillum sp. CPCC 100848]